ncbi:glycosyltransferase [Candidatus Pacearchaeota archaeon]|nr:glycosyltransferase [Candidatus Pacearchaeota archaeon]
MTKLSLIIPIGPNRKLYALDSIKKQNEKINTIIEEGSNPSENRNNGIKKSKTKLIGFINAHSILPEKWASEVIKFFGEHPNIDIVGGPQLTSKNDPIFERASGYALSSVFGAAEASTRYKIKELNLNANEKHLTSANLICKRKVAEKIKFDESLWPGEDPRFLSDAKNYGFKIAYSPDIVVYHKRRGTFNGLIKQIFNYGLTRPKKEGLKETIKKPIFLVPSLFLLYIIFLPILIMIHFMFVIPLILYWILNFSFSLYEGIKNKEIVSVFLLPILFFVIHISYGLGFLYGTLNNRFKL